MGDLISFEGRINRGTYWKFVALFAVVYIVAAFLWGASVDSFTGEPNGFVTFLFVVLMLAMVPVSLSFSVRRWHDLDKSGWWVLISLVPFVGGLYALVMTGFVAGTDGHNSYGPPPGHGQPEQEYSPRKRVV